VSRLLFFYDDVCSSCSEDSADSIFIPLVPAVSAHRSDMAVSRWDYEKVCDLLGETEGSEGVEWVNIVQSH